MLTNLFFRRIQHHLAIACTALSCALLTGCAGTAQSHAPSATTVQNEMSDGSSMYAFDIDRTQLKVSDTWTYAYTGIAKKQGQFSHTVAALSAQEMQLLVANPAHMPFTVKAKLQYRMPEVDEAFINLFDIFNKSMIVPYSRPRKPPSGGGHYITIVDCSSPKSEVITVAVGALNTSRYDCTYRVETGERKWTGKGGPYSIWYSNEVKNIAKFEFISEQGRYLNILNPEEGNYSIELINYKLN